LGFHADNEMPSCRVHEDSMDGVVDSFGYINTWVYKKSYHANGFNSDLYRECYYILSELMNIFNQPEQF